MASRRQRRAAGGRAGGSPTHLAGLALAVNLAEPRPLAQLLGLRHGDEVDALLGAERLDELLVVGLVAVIGQDAELRLAALNRAAGGRGRGGGEGAT